MTADFERAVIPRCLECHATYFEATVPDPEINIYDTTNFVLGISCERCHGPGRRHVAAHNNPGSTQAAATIGSKFVYIDINGQRIRPKFRSHWIKVYTPEELQ